MSETAIDPRFTHAILAAIEEARGRDIPNEAIIEMLRDALQGCARSFHDIPICLPKKSGGQRIQPRSGAG